VDSQLETRKTGVVGCGKVGHLPAKALSRLPESRSVVACDSNFRPDRQFAAEYNVQSRLSEEGKDPSDAAIFAWASVNPRVAHRVNKADEERFRLLVRLGRRDQMELFYLVWLGFVARGQRVPESRKRFPEIARTTLRLFRTPPRGIRRPQRTTRG